MKTLIIVAVAAGVALVATPADAKKRTHVRKPHVVVTQANPYAVYDYDGEYLGSDPDPFIRLMIKREGKIRDQIGR